MNQIFIELSKAFYPAAVFVMMHEHISRAQAKYQING